MRSWIGSKRCFGCISAIRLCLSVYLSNRCRTCACGGLLLGGRSATPFGFSRHFVGLIRHRDAAATAPAVSQSRLDKARWKRVRGRAVGRRKRSMTSSQRDRNKLILDKTVDLLAGDG